MRTSITTTLFVLLALAGARGAVGAEQLYEVKKQDAAARVGAKGKASVVIQTKNGWHVNEEAPISMLLKPGAGIAVDKPRLGRPDLAEKSKDSARFDVAFTASEVGQRTIDAQVKFVVCQETTCKPVTEKLALQVTVTK